MCQRVFSSVFAHVTLASQAVGLDVISSSLDPCTHGNELCLVLATCWQTEPEL